MTWPGRAALKMARADVAELDIVAFSKKGDQVGCCDGHMRDDRVFLGQPKRRTECPCSIGARIHKVPNY